MAASIVVGILTLAVVASGAGCWSRHAPGAPNATPAASVRMLDGRQWTKGNLAIPTEQSFCYDNAEAQCAAYGRLYTWDAARRACASLGSGWRLPTNDDWRDLARRYGGIRDDSTDGGKAAYASLVRGGSSGFDALLGGGRAVDGGYARLDAHGFYWTASSTSADRAWFYNFGKGSQFLNRHDDGEKGRAFSVRCVRGEMGPRG